MTTITALNVRLGMDVSNFNEGANLAKNELNRVATIVRQSVPPADKYRAELDLLNRAFSETGKQSKQYADAVDFLNRKHQQGKYSAEEVAKAQKQLADAQAAAAAAAKRQKEELARLAEAERQRQVVLEKGKQVTLSVEKAQETHNRKIREYQQLLRQGAISQETFTRAVAASNKALKNTQTSSNGALVGVKQLAAAYVGFQTVTKSLNLAMQIEDANVAFETLTGSVQDGKVLFEQIREFAAASPITFTNAAQATKTMLSFGIAAQDTQRNLQMLSDITGGNNERFKSLTLAFSQMSSAGRLMGQDLLQMINVGFNPLQQISKMTGESMVDLKKRMEDGGISSEEVRRAFEAATAAGGMFHGMTERLAGTLSGQLNIALSQTEQKLAEAGKAMAPVIIQVLNIFQQLSPILDVIVRTIDAIAQGLGFAIAAATDLINSISTFSVDTTEMNKFLDELEARERREQQAKRDANNKEFDQKKQQAEALAAQERKAQQEALKARQAEMEAHKKAMEERHKERQKQMEQQRKEQLKAIEDAKKEEERKAKAVRQQFEKDMGDARKAAMDFFAEKQRQQEQRRADISRGPGAGMEAGSAEAAKFAADLVNQRIGGAVAPDLGTPGEMAIVEKAAELFREQKATNAKADKQIVLLENLLTESKANAYRRFR